MTHANTRPGHDTTEETREIHPAVITWALVIGLLVAFAVTASSFKLSFTTLLDLATMAGMRDSAWVIPVVLDGPILAASILRIALSQHTDRRTVLGRRFIIAVFALAGVASMAGNAYHAVLTVRDLNAAVAAALAALSPLMVMTMGEMMSVAIRAPRRIVTTPPAATVDEASNTDTSQRTDPQGTGSTIETTAVDEDVDNGLLKPAVWASVHLWLENPEMPNSEIAKKLKIHTSTVGRHLKAWNDVQRKMAQDRSAEHFADAPHTAEVDGEDMTGTDDSARNSHDIDESYPDRNADENGTLTETATYAYAGAAR
ncbi:hypothetical protein CH267_10465 [Rhodococcus sp. 06-621-2]|nr:DUF2637 domain-containing protein [Rhodococcus sp. 06-621-2]OZC56590.1 hypothetical protein CH267_10465 [Rhodococcus sp. 06-621-2]